MERRTFLASVAGGLAVQTALAVQDPSGFRQHQEKRRKELWGLLGDLPWNYQSKPPQQIKTETGPGYQLEHLVLDLNGQEPVPAYLLIPEKRQPKAPGPLYLHAHGGSYPLGKKELLQGCRVMPAYA